MTRFPQVGQSAGRRALAETIHGFASDRNGSLAIHCALVMVPIMLAVTAAIDLGNAVRVKTSLQAAADAGVIAAATAFASGYDDSDRERIALDTFNANLSPALLKAFPTNPEVTIDFPGRKVQIDVKANTDQLLSNLLTDSMALNVKSAALVDKGSPVCMMALNPSAWKSLNIQGTADVEAEGCSVHVNSGHGEAMRQNGSGQMSAESFCVHGDYSGSNYAPKPRRYCMAEQDPLAEAFGADLDKTDLTTCRADNPKTINNSSGEVVMEPGVYCGGLTVKQGTLKLKPGVHVFRDGAFEIQAQGSVIGEGVTILLTGDDSTRLVNQAGADLNLTAPSSGKFAGIAIAQDPDSIPAKANTVIGGGYMKIDGIMYFPVQPLLITGNGVIGEDSKQFAIIADTISIEGNGVLEIKVSGDYQAAGLPKLPEANEMVRLVQ